MDRRLTVMLALLSICGVVLAKKPIQWEVGHVVSQDMSSQNGGVATVPYGGAIITVPIRTSSNTAVVDVGNMRYMWAEVGNKRIVLIVNSDVQFYRDGNWFIVLDTKGGKHKFSVMAARQKDPPESH